MTMRNYHRSVVLFNRAEIGIDFTPRIWTVGVSVIFRDAPMLVLGLGPVAVWVMV